MRLAPNLVGVLSSVNRSRTSRDKNVNSIQSSSPNPFVSDSGRVSSDRLRWPKNSPDVTFFSINLFTATASFQTLKAT